MRNTNGYVYNLQGTGEERGRQIAKRVTGTPFVEAYKGPQETWLTKAEESEVRESYHRSCPGLNEELDSFCEELKIPYGALNFHAFSFLRPGCSQLVVQRGRTAEKKLLMARNYDFGVEMEDMAMIVQKPEKGMKTIASTIATFGRVDGINEAGLAITMSASGFPVGNLEFMRKPAIKGLQFWVAIRGALENCKNVKDALVYLKELPIAYNANLILGDSKNDCALFETYDGTSQYRFLDGEKDTSWLAATNHSLFPNTLEKIIENKDPLMKNSLVRYNKIKELLSEKSNIIENELKALLERKYPEGLLCHYYPEFFGTVRSMVIRPEEGTMSVCLGSNQQNQWMEFDIKKDYEDQILDLEIPDEKAPEGFFLPEDYSLF